MPPTVYAKLFFIIIFLIIKICCFQKTLRAENFVIAVGGRPRFPFEVSEVLNKFILKVLERLSLRFQVAVQIQQVGRESNRQGFLLVLFFSCFPLAVAGGPRSYTTLTKFWVARAIFCWFSPLLREVFLRFSLLLKNQHFQIPVRPGIRYTKNHY